MSTYEKYLNEKFKDEELEEVDDEIFALETLDARQVRNLKMITSLIGESPQTVMILRKALIKLEKGMVLSYEHSRPLLHVLRKLLYAETPRIKMVFKK